MNKITAYEILKSEGHEALAEKVSARIKEGFQPLGGPFTAVIEPHPKTSNFYQAMVKYVED